MIVLLLLIVLGIVGAYAFFGNLRRTTLLLGFLKTTLVFLLLI